MVLNSQLIQTSIHSTVSCMVNMVPCRITSDHKGPCQSDSGYLWILAMAISTPGGVSCGLLLNDCNRVESSPASCQNKTLFSLGTFLACLH